MYYIDSIDLKLIPIQVETYAGQSNQSKENNKTVNEDYAIEEEAICNLDNEANAKKRIVIPDLKKYSRIFNKKIK